MITGYDHFIVLVNDLAQAMTAYRQLGFAVNAGGAHPAFGSHNALVAFADGTYLELLAFTDEALAAKTFWQTGVSKLRTGEGFGGFVLASNELAAEVARCRALNLGAPQPGSRVRPDGQRVVWQTALFASNPSGALPFLIQDETPRDLRVEPARDGIGSRARVKQVIVAVQDLDAARDAYRALLAVEPKLVHNAASDVLGYRFALDWGSLVLATSERDDNAMGEQLARRGDGLYALTLQVNGMGRDRREIKNRGIQIVTDANGFLIDPSAACGARLRIV